jgi:hypothetical protein
VFGGGASEDQQIIEIRETKVKTPRHLVHETLESLPGISEAKRNEGELE